MLPRTLIDRSEPRDGQMTLALMRRVSITMFIVGGLTCLSGVWITQQTPQSRTAQGLIAVGFLMLGAIVLVIRHPRRWILEVATTTSIVLLSTLVALSNPIGMAPMFYLWPIVFVAYFSRRRTVALMYGLAVASLGVGLALNANHPLKLDTFTGTVTTVGIMGLLVSTMTDREAGLRRELALAAETDPLTGLLNRRSFDPHIELLVGDAIARRRLLSVVMFDLDHFKRLNDERGHLVGDRALREFAEVLGAQSREGDVVSRFGGEEFVVVLPGADVDVARRYTERVAGALVELARASDLQIMTSAGICPLDHLHTSASTLLVGADQALYAAKAGGRARQASWVDGEIVVGQPFIAGTAELRGVTDAAASSADAPIWP